MTTLAQDHATPADGEAAVTETQQHIDLVNAHAAHNYHPLPVVLSHGEGAWVTDVEGRRYLDCLAGYSRPPSRSRAGGAIRSRA